MFDGPTYADLAAVPFAVLCGLVHEFGEAAWNDRYDFPALRCHAVLNTTDQALRAAARGEVPAAERSDPPRWLTTAARQRMVEMSEFWISTGGFDELRRWERLGLVTLPDDDTAVLAMIGSLTDRWAGPKAALLRDDAELRERLWRFFDVEGGGEISLAGVDSYSRVDATWRAAFQELVDDGTLDRGRVLTSCLDALQRDFGAFRAQWFSALYRSLGPTAEEAREHQGAYRALLRSAVRTTVSLAARQLRAVSAADALDDDACATLQPGLSARTKGAALDVLRVLGDIARRRADLYPVLVTVVPTACEHPHVDVQRAAVALLARLGADPLAHADALAPSLRAELGAVESAVPVVVPVAPPVPALVPVTAADLLDRTAAVLEDAGDPLEVELVLAALAATADPGVLAPLRKRAEKLIRSGPPDGAAEDWLRGQLARLVLARPPVRSRDSRVQFLVRRLIGVADVLAGRRAPTVLLATPDSADGYLDPARLLHRLARSDGPPRTEDLVAAVLRLGVDGRADALEELDGDDTITRVLRHALGAPTPDDDLTGAHALWAAAARVRHPGADDAYLMRAGLDRAGQGRPVRARVETGIEVVHELYADTTRPVREVTFTVRIEHPATRPDPGRPLLGTGVEQYWEGWEQWVGWLMALSPHDLEPVLTDLVRAVLYAGVGYGVMHDATRVLTGLTRHPGPLGPLGHAALAAGLTADRADHRVLAVDAVAGFVTTGRLAPPELAAAMASQQLTARPGRWAGALATLAQACPGPFVGDLLTALLPALPGDLRGAYALVELLREETVRGGRRVSDPALRGWLSALPGNGRGPRAARALIT